jgi:hypothetical protein
MKTSNYKKLILFLFINLTFSCYSQTNLEFNRVVTQAGALSGSNFYQTSSITVPDGKVWKLERYTRNQLYINNVLIQDMYFSSSFPVIDDSPLWLNEGDSFYFQFQFPCCNPVNTSWYFSALEFNKN